MTIRARILATYLLLVTLGITILSMYHRWAFRDYFVRPARVHLAARALALSDSVVDALVRGDEKELQRLVDENGAQGGVKVRVIGPDGTLLATANPERDRRVTDWKRVPGIGEGLRGEASSGVGVGLLAHRERIYAARPLRKNGRIIAVLRGSLTLDQFNQELQRSELTDLATGALTFIICTVVSLLLARGIAAPIRVMRNFAVRVGEGHFLDKLELHRKDELRELAREQ